MNQAGDVALVDVELHEERREEFGGIEGGLVFPEELAAIDNAAAAQVKEVGGEQGRLGIEGENVGVVAVGGGHLLTLLHFVDGGDEVAQGGGLFKAKVLGGGLHAHAQIVGEVAQAAFEKELYALGGFGVLVVGDEATNARAQAAMDVILQAGMSMGTGEIHLTGGHQKVAMNKIQQTISEIGGEIRPIVSAALPQTPRDKDAGELLIGELDVRVSFVVAQKNIEARLPLLDEVVLERQRLLLVVDDDDLDVLRDLDQGAGFGVGEAVLVEIAADAASQVLRLADVKNLPGPIFVEVDAGGYRELGDLLAQRHRFFNSKAL